MHIINRRLYWSSPALFGAYHKIGGRQVPDLRNVYRFSVGDGALDVPLINAQRPMESAQAVWNQASACMESPSAYGINRRLHVPSRIVGCVPVPLIHHKWSPFPAGEGIAINAQRCIFRLQLVKFRVNERAFCAEAHCPALVAQAVGEVIILKGVAMLPSALEIGVAHLGHTV